MARGDGGDLKTSFRIRKVGLHAFGAGLAPTPRDAPRRARMPFTIEVFGRPDAASLTRWPAGGEIDSRVDLSGPPREAGRGEGRAGAAGGSARRPRTKKGRPAGRPLACRGGDAQIRTGGKGFAGLCLTTWRRRRSKRAGGDRPSSRHGADNGARTRDPNLGKVVLYQLSHVRVRVGTIRNAVSPRKSLTFCTHMRALCDGRRPAGGKARQKLGRRRPVGYYSLTIGSEGDTGSSRRRLPDAFNGAPEGPARRTSVWSTATRLRCSSRWTMTLF